MLTSTVCRGMLVVRNRKEEHMYEKMDIVFSGACFVDFTESARACGRVGGAGGGATRRAALGAKLGAMIGALGTIYAPVTVPILSLAGGIAGSFAGDALAKWVVDITYVGE